MIIKIINASPQLGIEDMPLLVDLATKAHESGKKIPVDFILKGLAYTSPLISARQTLSCILIASGALNEYESINGKNLFHVDPRLRESQSIEISYNGYDRASLFIEEFSKIMTDKRISRGLIISHSYFIQCLLMRWLQLSINQIKQIKLPNHADIITISGKDALKNPVLVSGKLGVSGISLKH